MVYSSQPVLPNPGNLSHLLGYFLDRVRGDDYVPPPGEECNTQQLELVVEQDDLHIRVLHDEGPWYDVLPSWYSPETRRERGFTPDYFRQISAEVEASAEWRTKGGAPVLTYQDGSGIAPLLRFLKVTQKPNRILFTKLGYLVTEKVLPNKKPLQLHNHSTPTIYPR